MKKLLICLAFGLAILFTAPSADALTLQQQRNQVFVALKDVMAEIRSEITDLQTERSQTRNRRDRLIINQRLKVAYGRLRFIQSTRTLARYNYNETQLDALIMRYNLAVSLS